MRVIVEIRDEGFTTINVSLETPRSTFGPTPEQKRRTILEAADAAMRALLPAEIVAERNA